MKVVIHNEGLELRGSERQIVLLAEGLRRRGHRVVVSCHPDGELWQTLRERRFRTTHIRPRGDLDLWAAARFTAFLRRERPHAVLLTAYRRLFWSTLAARLAGDSRVVVRLGLVRPLKRRWKYRSAFRRVDALMANSEAVAGAFRASAADFSAEVHVVHNATRAPADAPHGALRAELGLDEETPLLLSLGSLAVRKGYDVLLDALPAVPGAHLAIAGDGPEASSLRDRAERLGVAGRVHFLGVRADVPALLADADLFVLASRNDSLSNAMLEAMAAGVPVVVTDVGGVSWAVGPVEGRGPAGWVAPVEDVAALGSTLAEAVEVCRGPEGAARGAEGARRAAEWFAPARMAEEAEAVLFPEIGVPVRAGSASDRPATARPSADGVDTASRVEGVGDAEAEDAEAGDGAAGDAAARGLWDRWQRRWRRLETSDPAWRVKRAIRQRTGREPRSRVELRLGAREHGEWWVYPDALDVGAVVYAFGVGRDLRFERLLATRYGARVWAFDPTPWTVSWVEGQALPEGLEFRPVGVAGYDGTASFQEPDRADGCHSMVEVGGQTGGTVDVPVRRLPTLVRELGHDRIDLLKLDVEGAEYDAIRDLVAMDVSVPQVLVEFHHRFARVGPYATRESLDLMAEAGYLIFHISPSGREYSFLHEDHAP